MVTPWLELGLPTVVAAYYATVLLAVRKTPPELPLVVQYAPPDKLSPAAMRYVWKGCVDQRTVASVFAELATKGYIQITPEIGRYRIRKLRAVDAEMAKEERLAMEWLFSNFLNEREFDPVQSSQGCIASLSGSITRQMRNVYHRTHYGYVVLGLLLSFVAAFVMAFQSHSKDHAGVYLLTYMIFVGVLMASIVFMVLVEAGRDLLRGLGSFSRVIFGVLTTALIAVPMAIVTGDLAFMTSPGMAVGIAVMAVMNVVAGRFLRTSTERGFLVRREIDGFREFVLAVDQDRLDRIAGAPHVRKEANLGYAIALEVKEAWGSELANACYPQFSN